MSDGETQEVGPTRRWSCAGKVVGGLRVKCLRAYTPRTDAEGTRPRSGRSHTAKKIF